MRLSMPWFVAALGVVGAGIIHISAVLAIPYVAPLNAWARLAAFAPENAIAVLPPATPTTQVMPLMAPDIRYVACRYNIADGPVRMRLNVLDDLWSIAFYNQIGDNFYTLRGSDMRRQRANLVIAAAEQRLLETGTDAPQDTDEIILVTSPVTEGIAMIRAPLQSPGYAAQADAALAEAICEPYQPSAGAPAATSPAPVSTPAR